MMDLVLLANIIACAGALGGFIFGAIKYFRLGVSIYALMIRILLICGAVALGLTLVVICVILVKKGAVFGNKQH